MNKLNFKLLTASVIAALTMSATVDAAPKKKKAAQAGRAAPAKAPARAGTGDVASANREKVALPTSTALKAPVATRSLGAVKPPRSNDFYEGNNKEAEYESLVDQEIKALYNLSQANKRSPNRGEIWLRLGERYVEKARLVEFREQANYDKELKNFTEKKTRVRPKIDTRLSREYNRKAIELYQWFVQDFAKDPKVDQALFFLGYNQFELGNVEQGERYYLQLLQQFPESPYVVESRFALGEYYFENEQWQKALDNYTKVVEAKRARLNAFALYKASWCYYRLGRAAAGLKALERVVRLSRAAEVNDNIAGAGGKRAVNKVRLASEALKDYVPFFAEVGDPRRAYSEFQRVSGDEKQATQMLERLAYIYADAGARANANSIFKQLISMNPNGERAAEYQYQVVLAYATSEPRAFRSELEIWLNMFGPESDWAKANAKNAKLVSDMANLQETTVRNNVLQLHQTAQNSRIESAQKAAAQAYAQYFRFFPNSQKQIEMRFFYAELLYDMERFTDAAKLYNYVADHDEPTGKYRERAIVNTLLALEKDLPTTQEIDAKRGKSIEPLPLDPPVARFESYALKYANAFPKSEKASDILRRLGVLYYGYNQFDKAIDVFERILRDYPKSPNAEIAGNLILDIYKLKGDMIGLADKGQAMLQNPSIANTAFGTKIRGMMEKASFMKADKLAEKGDPAAAAKQYEQFATSYKASDLAVASRYKAAANYEKAGDLVSAMRMHSMILAGDGSDPKIRAVQNDSCNALSHLYQQTGQLELAAKSYHDYASTNAKDTKAINGFFNAGVLFDALGDYNQAQANYDMYFAKSKNVDRIEVLYLEAQIWKKRGNQGRAAAYFDRYIKEGGRNQAHVVEAVYEMARNAKRLGQVTKQKELWQEVISRYKRAGDAKTATAAYAAEAQFELSQAVLRDLNSIRFYKNAKQQAQAANDIKQFREKYINEMKKVILFDNAKWIIAALTSSGQMFESVARKFDGIQTPNGFSEDDAKKYRELITQQSNGFREEAKNSYKTAIDRSQELESYSEWTTAARQGLAGLDPAMRAKDAGEVASEAAATDWMGL